MCSMAEEASTSLSQLSLDEQQAAGPSQAKPIAIIVIGMAGSGKTTFMQRINSHLHAKGIPGYIINLDPAVTHLPYGANIDIRDTVNYKNVMQQYNLGPNGGILTSLNLFATRFDQVISLVEKPRDPPLKYVVADTPGQIEIFTWSASGSIVTEAFASTMPTLVAYVMDTPRCAAPQTFMTNMLQACSILYKSRLPLLLVFNKVDVARHEFALEWMADYEAFQAALEHDATYAATLSRSLSLVLEEFYQNLRAVGVSAVTGEGMEEFFAAVQSCAREYDETYRPELEKKLKEREELERRRQEAELAKLRADVAQDAAAGQPSGTAGGAAAAAAPAGGAGQHLAEGQPPVQPPAAPRGRVVLDGRKGASLVGIDEEEGEQEGAADRLLDLD